MPKHASHLSQMSTFGGFVQPGLATTKAVAKVREIVNSGCNFHLTFHSCFPCCLVDPKPRFAISLSHQPCLTELTQPPSIMTDQPSQDDTVPPP